MNDVKKAVLAIGARLLSYPDEALYNEQQLMQQSVDEFITSVDMKIELSEALYAVFGRPMSEQQVIYVETFDYKDKTSLYLTAHECGDSRERGMALIELQSMIRDAGFETNNGELADYMPMMLEYVAAVPESEQTEKLIRRLACAVHRILEHLDEENPYAAIFGLLRRAIFVSPTAEEIAQFEKERQEPDLDPMPYPVMYQ